MPPKGRGSLVKAPARNSDKKAWADRLIIRKPPKLSRSATATRLRTTDVAADNAKESARYTRARSELRHTLRDAETMAKSARKSRQDCAKAQHNMESHKQRGEKLRGYKPTGKETANRIQAIASVQEHWDKSNDIITSGLDTPYMLFLSVHFRLGKLDKLIRNANGMPSQRTGQRAQLCQEMENICENLKDAMEEYEKERDDLQAYLKAPENAAEIGDCYVKEFSELFDHPLDPATCNLCALSNPDFNRPLLMQVLQWRLRQFVTEVGCYHLMDEDEIFVRVVLAVVAKGVGKGSLTAELHGIKEGDWRYCPDNGNSQKHFKFTEDSQDHSDEIAIPAAKDGSRPAFYLHMSQPSGRR